MHAAWGMHPAPKHCIAGVDATSHIQTGLCCHCSNIADFVIMAVAQPLPVVELVHDLDNPHALQEPASSDEDDDKAGSDEMGAASTAAALARFAGLQVEGMDDATLDDIMLGAHSHTRLRHRLCHTGTSCAFCRPPA